MNKCLIERRAAWFSVLFLGIILAGCKKPSEVIGDNLVSDAERLGLAITDTVSIQMRTVEEDSLRSDELSVLQIGAYNDLETGSFNIASSMHLRLSSNDVDFGTPSNIVVDSVRLLLAHNALSFLGDSTYNLQLTARELETEIVYDSNYYTTTEIKTIGDNILVPNANGYTINPQTPTVYGEDSLQVPVLVLPVNKSFAEKIIAKSGSVELSDNENFVQFMKGIQIKAEATPGAGQGFVFGVNPNSIYSAMYIYYRDTILQDTVRFDLNINNQSATVTSIDADFTGSTVATHLADTNLTVSTSFVKSGGLLKTVMKLPYLESFRELDGMAVNQAQLELPLAQHNEGVETPHTKLFLSVYNTNNDLVVAPDILQGEAFFSGEIVGDKYVFRISQYIQQVLRGTYPNLGIHIVARNSGITSNRTILSTENSLTSKPKLIITYSRF
tara:strand:- start:447237 stop:448565 length:1329 start_codon:yes stop_codon:yes gene_type:complete